MPKLDIRSTVGELEAQNDHVGVVSLCNRLLARRDRLSREERVFLLQTQAKHLAMMNPEVWHNHISSALLDALTEAAGDPVMEARLLAALAFADIVLAAPLQTEARTVRRFEALVSRHPEVRRFGGDLYYNLARTYEDARDYASAESRYRLALSIYQENFAEAGDAVQERKAAETLHNLAHVLIKAGRVPEAKLAVEEANRHIPAEHGLAKYLGLKAKIALTEGDVNTAREFFANALAQPSADDWTRVDLLYGWAQAEVNLGDGSRAQDLVKQALLLAYKLPYGTAIRDLEMLLTEMGGGDE